MPVDLTYYIVQTMMKIIRDFKSEFSSWDEVLNEVKNKKIFCPDVSNRKLTNALKKISSVAHPNFFRKPEFEYIISLINQVKYYLKERSFEHHSFVDELYGISKLIKLVKRIPTAQKLFKADIFSNFGMYNQFLITAFLSKRLKIIDLEVNNKPFNTDILAEYGGLEIHFHIKDISEHKREERLSDAIYIIDHFLSERAKARNAKRRLAVSTFIGVPPEGLGDDYWEKFAKELKEKSQTVKLRIPISSTTKNSKPVKISITFVWKEFSGIFNSPLSSFNNQLNLVSKYNEINKLIKTNHMPKNQTHMLIALTDDQYNWQSLRKDIKNDKLGLVLFHLIEFDYQRSPFMLPLKYQSLEIDLNKIFPNSVKFVFK